MRKIILIIKGCYYYCVGHLLFIGRYQKKYLTGRHFSNIHHGVGAPGWQWAVKDWLECRRRGVNQDVPWPVSGCSRVICPENVSFHPDDLNNFQGIGNYYQGNGRIEIGRGTYIAMNVGIITANHDLNNLNCHQEAKPVVIGEQCWLGMNSVVLPGVTLGDGTIVGAGSVVTKSFPEGHCVICGNPAKKIRDL